MPRPVSLKDVAARLGVDSSTVSRALRDHPRISPETREAVKRAARDLGYRASPMVTALMRLRRARQSEQHVVLAYVTAYPTRYGWRPPHHDRPDYYPGAAARAKELGYKLEHFWLAEPGMTPARFASILINRGISGLLIGRLPPGRGELELPWDQFSCVALGLTLRAPQLHHVTEAAFASAHTAMDELLARGARRVGFVFSEPDDSPGVGRRYLGAYLEQQLRLAKRDRLPHCGHVPGAGFPAHFLRWFDRWRPDAVLATHAAAVLAAFAAEGREPPLGLRLVSLINDKPDQGFSGIYHDPAQLGALAVDALVGMLHRGETGLPGSAHFVQVPGRWVEGTR